MQKVDEKDRPPFKQTFMAIAIVLFTGAMFATTKEQPHDIPQSQTQAPATPQISSLEDTTSLEEIPAAPKKEEVKASTVETPNLVKINEKYYFLFDSNVILPLTSNTWKEYAIEAQDGVGATSEFYSEPPEQWTRKFVAHGPLQNTNDNCFDFVDKLVNGTIISLNEQMFVEGQELTKDNITFSFVKKEPDDTLLVWKQKGIPHMDNEVQVLRCFKGKVSGKMILVTYTLKTDSLDSMQTSQLVRMMQQVQELRAKNRQS